MDIIFYGEVKQGGIVPKRPHHYKSFLEGLEGKEIEMIIREKVKKPTSSQYAYYFGGIIKITCMASIIFLGWTEKEIDDHLRYAVGGKLDFNGDMKKIDFKDPRWSKYKMADYITAVIAYLATEGIEVLSPEEYSYNKNIKNG